MREDDCATESAATAPTAVGEVQPRAHCRVYFGDEHQQMTSPEDFEPDSERIDQLIKANESGTRLWLVRLVHSFFFFVVVK